MSKKLIFFLYIFSVLLAFIPLKVNAIELYDVTDNFYILVNNTTNRSNTTTSQDMDCDGSNSILGNPEDENSVAWLLQQIFNFIKIVGPILVVVLSSIDYAKVIIQSDDESMGKANKKLMWRLILAALLFFIPLLIQVFLQMFGFTSDPTCGIH